MDSMGTMTRLAITKTMAMGKIFSTNPWGMSGRDWKTMTKVRRYRASGTTQNSGTEATSVAICEVTARSRPEGTAASATQRPASRQFGALLSVSAAEAAAGAAGI